ncbi:hypothetical protein PTKIN_Ptkin13bG0037200 [Pterospermum kingtungense]
MATAISDFFREEIVPELLQELFAVSSKSYLCKSSADNLISSIQQLLPIIEEIKNTGVELPAHRQSQLNHFSDTLRGGLELAREVLASSRWNVYKNLQLARKMEKLENQIERFVKVQIHVHLLADVHHLRFQTMERFDRLEAWSEKRLDLITIGSGGRRVEEPVLKRRRVEEETSLGNLGKNNVKRTKIGTNDLNVAGIWGIGESGKTTLANDLCRDKKFQELTGMKPCVNISLEDARSGDAYGSFYEICFTEHDVLRTLLFISAIMSEGGCLCLEEMQNFK